MASDRLTKMAANQAWLHLQQACLDLDSLENQVDAQHGEANRLLKKLHEDLEKSNEWIVAIKEQ